LPSHFSGSINKRSLQISKSKPAKKKGLEKSARARF
jgi:hypothetical protein